MSGLSECLLWRRARSTAGYGYVSWDGRAQPAHRVMYELCYGAIPSGYVVHHRCETPACVNPLHLEAVTQRENILLGVGASARNAAKTHCPRGHAYTTDNIYVTKRGGRECRACRIARSNRANEAKRQREAV